MSQPNLFQSKIFKFSHLSLIKIEESIKKSKVYGRKINYDASPHSKGGRKWCQNNTISIDFLFISRLMNNLWICIEHINDDDKLNPQTK